MLQYSSAGWRPLVDSGQFELTTFEPGGQIYATVFNTNVPGAGNEDLRKAVSLAVDREALAEAVTGGEGEVAYQFFPEGTPGYVPDLDEDAATRRMPGGWWPSRALPTRPSPSS